MAALTQNLIVESAAIMPALLWDDVIGGNDPLLSQFAPGYVDSDKVQYHQYESPYGLTSLRGLGGAPPVRRMPGYRVYELDPGYFGDETQVNEAEITKGVQPGTLADPLDVKDWLGKLMLDFHCMISSRFRVTLADMLADGTVRITDSQGNVFQYTIPGYRTFTPGTAWVSSAATATPITDLLTQKAVLQKGTSTKFGAESTLQMNSATLANYFKTNQVQNVYRAKFGASIIGLDGTADLQGVNQIHQGFDLPKIEVYDYGYFPTLADAKARTYANWVYAVPTNTVLWLGKRPGGQKLGQFQLTRHAGKVGMSDGNKYPSVSVQNEGGGLKGIEQGLFVRADYRPRMPNGYDIQVGFNGCPVLWYDDSACGITTT